MNMKYLDVIVNFNIHFYLNKNFKKLTVVPFDKLIKLNQSIYQE